jgi:CubicO group peptidase (beta-lactamase class C family)
MKKMVKTWGKAAAAFSSVVLAAGAYTLGPRSTAADAAAPAQASPAVWAGFDAWLKQQAAAGQFAGTVLVAQRGRTLLDSGYGLADRTTGVPDASQTKFCIASIGKLFTAVAIAQLVQRHRLAFTDTIGKYLTGFAPAIADSVTIGELLDMTSGFGDVALGRTNPPTTLAGMMQLIETEPLQSRPGAGFLYSNDGYIVLGAIIQIVTGRTYSDYVTEHVLEPAGMTHTSLAIYTPADITGMAHGYALTGTPPAPATWQDVSTRPELANPSGGAYSTVGDLRAFAHALTDHRLLSPQMTATVFVPRISSPQLGGPPVDMYTYGFSYQQLAGGPVFVGHNGGTPGYAGQLDIYPETGYVVVILTNQDRALVPAIQRSETLVAQS